MFGFMFNNLKEERVITTPVGEIQILVEEDENDFLETTKALAVTGLIWNEVTYKRSIVFYRPFIEAHSSDEINFITQHEVGHLVYDHTHIESALVHNACVEIQADLYALKQTGYNGSNCIQQVYKDSLSKMELPKTLVILANIEMMVRATVLNIVALKMQLTKLF